MWTQSDDVQYNSSEGIEYVSNECKLVDDDIYMLKMSVPYTRLIAVLRIKL